LFRHGRNEAIDEFTAINADMRGSNKLIPGFSPRLRASVVKLFFPEAEQYEDATSANRACPLGRQG
jgi:hypothetical protein